MLLIVPGNLGARRDEGLGLGSGAGLFLEGRFGFGGFMFAGK